MVDSQLDALYRAAREGDYEAGRTWTGRGWVGYGTWLRKKPSRRPSSLPQSVRRVITRTQVLVMEELQRTGCGVLFLNHAFG